MFVWLRRVVNDRKFPAGTVFFSHTNQPAVLLHQPATKRTSQPNRLNPRSFTASEHANPLSSFCLARLLAAFSRMIQGLTFGVGADRGRRGRLSAR